MEGFMVQILANHTSAHSSSSASIFIGAAIISVLAVVAIVAVMRTK